MDAPGWLAAKRHLGSGRANVTSVEFWGELAELSRGRTNLQQDCKWGDWLRPGA